MWSISKMIANQLFVSGWIFGIRAVEGKIEPLRALEKGNGEVGIWDLSLEYIKNQQMLKAKSIGPNKSKLSPVFLYAHPVDLYVTYQNTHTLYIH